jgi:hypothetical protein
MAQLRTSSGRPGVTPRLPSWCLVVAATAMFSALPLNFDGQLNVLRLSSAEAAAQCAAQPLLGSGCAQTRCVRAGPCYAGLFYQARGCLRWSCSGRRAGRIQH